MLRCVARIAQEEIKMKQKLKTAVLLAIIFSIGLIGCDSGHPVPAEAFKLCASNGGTPVYKSNMHGTKFSCVLPGEELKNFKAN